MTSYLLEFASLMAVFSFAIVSPGADLAMVMRQAILHGRRQAVITSFGIGTALMFHVSYTILGLGLIISQSITLFNIVKWCGVAYLVYIGIKALKAKKAVAEDPAAHAAPSRAQSAPKAFLLGFAANALNPKPVFFFLSIFSTVVSVQTPMEVKFVYGLIMATALIAWFVSVSLFMTTPRMRAAFTGISHWIDRASGAVFIALGLKLAMEKAH
ncbi:lysine transporter LysE [Rhizobium rhizosphaerae]|uniref:Lysine transporter LysE n=1 Tax=Xaviernesmea rhizosphaerae TaxID=1672749 RepID=A0A1Q9ALN5_9HYPH|nr:LysE family transporter [Xaviernesmea rhizosphaerae]OLP56159.1 lysine transporter LysE [Xaviernesmea rhizosphaerae]